VVDGKTFKEGDWISLNGSTGEVYEGKIKTMDPELSGDFGELMNLLINMLQCKFAPMQILPRCESCPKFGAQGIGLCRTEHMFFEGDRIKAMREMILANDEAGRRKALEKLLPIQREDFEGIFEAMHGSSLLLFVCSILLYMSSFLTKKQIRRKWQRNGHFCRRCKRKFMISA
jgi:pyruvate, orthophosphate dikinase